MDWWAILGIAVGSVLLILPVALIWYLHIVGRIQGFKEDRGRPTQTDTPLSPGDETAVILYDGS